MEKCVYVVPWLRFWKVIHGDHEYFLLYTTKEEAVKLARSISEKTHEKLIIVENVPTSPEALAEFIHNLTLHHFDNIYPWCMAVINSGKTCSKNCVICIAEWLKQKAEKEDEE